MPGGESYQEDTDQFNEPELKWTKSLDLFGNYDDDLISEYGQPYQKEINYDAQVELKSDPSKRVHQSIDSILKDGEVGDTVTPALRRELQAFARGE